MKQLTILYFLTLGVAMCGSCQVKQTQAPGLARLSDEQLAKDYFLCMCLYQGFDKDAAFAKDHSLTVLRELMESAPYETLKLDSLARSVASSMEKSEYTGAKPIVWDCLKYYNSKEFEKIVKSLKTSKEKQPRE